MTFNIYLTNLQFKCISLLYIFNVKNIKYTSGKGSWPLYIVISISISIPMDYIHESAV